MDDNSKKVIARLSAAVVLLVIVIIVLLIVICVVARNNSPGACGTPDKKPELAVCGNVVIGCCNSVVLAQGVTSESFSRGNTLFKQNCAVCHSIGDNYLTGPGMAGVTDRVPNTKDWLLNYIRNADSMRRSGDAYSMKLYKENGEAAMSVFTGSLSDKDINDIIGYLKSYR